MVLNTPHAKSICPAPSQRDSSARTRHCAASARYWRNTLSGGSYRSEVRRGSTAGAMAISQGGAARAFASAKHVRPIRKHTRIAGSRRQHCRAIRFFCHKRRSLACGRAHVPFVQRLSPTPYAVAELAGARGAVARRWGARPIRRRRGRSKRSIIRRSLHGCDRLQALCEAPGPDGVGRGIAFGRGRHPVPGRPPTSNDLVRA